MRHPKTPKPDRHEPIIDSRAQDRGAERLRREGGIRKAFDSLGLGWDFDDLADYLTIANPHFPEELHGRLAGAVAAFAIVVAEKERESRLTISELVDCYSDGTLCPAAADTMRALISHNQKGPT